MCVYILFKRLSLLNPRKATGPDGIPGWVLKENADILAQPISNILNQSYREARLPQSWKSANITPIPKEKPVHNINKHFDSFVPWKHRIAWIRSLLSRIHKICSPTKLSQELQFLKKIASWNGYPKHVVSLLIKRFKQHQSTSNEDNNETETNDNRPILWLEMPYIGTKGEQLLRGFKKKLLRCLNINVQIKTRITTTKLNLFTNTKDKVPKQNKSNVVYEFTCPKCNSSYIGKTDRTLLERVKEHAYKDQESAVNKHLNSCYDTNYLDSKTNNELTDFVMTNSKIIDSSNNWNLLLYKEALHIKRRKSILNNGLKASRDLQLFN